MVTSQANTKHFCGNHNGFPQGIGNAKHNGENRLIRKSPTRFQRSYLNLSKETKTCSSNWKFQLLDKSKINGRQHKGRNGPIIPQIYSHKVNEK